MCSYVAEITEFKSVLMISQSVGPQDDLDDLMVILSSDSEGAQFAW